MYVDNLNLGENRFIFPQKYSIAGILVNLSSFKERFFKRRFLKNENFYLKRTLIRKIKIVYKNFLKQFAHKILRLKMFLIIYHIYDIGV